MLMATAMAGGAFYRDATRVWPRVPRTRGEVEDCTVMRWLKRARLLDGGPTPWSVSHAAMPVADRTADGLLRVYFSARDARGRSRIGYADFAPPAWTRPVRLAERPSLDLGELGAFDDSGVTASWVLTLGSQKLHYYTGWSLGVTVPFHLAAGLAVSTDGGETFERVSRAPLLDRSSADPLMTASPCVLADNGRFRMWYVSAVRWTETSGGPRHYYHIRYAESPDGVSWQRDGRVCIDFRDPAEYAISRPCVVKDGDRYRMWYSYRGAAYRIGYAESADGLEWTRLDDRAAIDVSPGSWDGEMQAYPYVFDWEGRRYMLYNGDGYGRTGLGVAEWCDD